MLFTNKVMKAVSVLILVSCLKVQVEAQFHDPAGLNKQNNARKKEEIANRIEDNWNLNAMTKATMTMQSNEKKKTRKRAQELGEANDPDGNPIPGNKPPILRPIDPRTPKTFGNLFLRKDKVDENMDAVLDNLTDEEKRLMDELNNEEDEEEEAAEMMLIHGAPRGICGKDREDAETRCGNTCDPEIPYCVRNSEREYEDMVGVGNGNFKFFDKCFADVLCTEPDSTQVLAMAAEGGDCAPLRMNNPCPNSCDCYKSKNNKRKCHKACEQTDNMNVLKCARMRVKGDKKRRNKTIRYLELNKQACDFNVYYNHALQDHNAIQGVHLPGLFGTH